MNDTKKSKWVDEEQEKKRTRLKDKKYTGFKKTLPSVREDNKYHRMPEIFNVKGFVVNVHDPINFDIDFELSQKTLSMYSSVISNNYNHKDLDENYNVENVLSNSGETIGTAYRCRLRGIAVNQTASSAWKNNQLAVEIKHLLDRSDAWVICTLSDIDGFKRLLIDIVIPTNNGAINLCEYLLNRMEGDDNPIFSPYKK